MNNFKDQLSNAMDMCNNKLAEDAVGLSDCLGKSTDYSDSVVAFLTNACFGAIKTNGHTAEQIEEALKTARGFRDDESVASITANVPKFKEWKVPDGKLNTDYLMAFMKKHADYHVWKGCIYVREIGAFHYIPMPTPNALRTYLLRLLCNGESTKLRSFQQRIRPAKVKRLYRDILDDPFAQDSGKKFINDGNCLLVSNYCIIVEDGQVFPIPIEKLKETGMYFTYAVNASYDENSKHETWDRFLEIFVGSEEDDIRRFWQMMGNLYFSNQGAKTIVIIHGDGNDGKSLLCSFIKRIMIPNKAVCDADSTTAFSTFGIAAFADSQIVFLHELNNPISQLTADIIKRLTGGDGVMINRKNKDIIDALLKVKLLITCNHIPSFEPGVIDQALINRLQFLKVNAPPKKYEDKQLLEKLWEERDYFITMSILGYADLQANQYQFTSSEKDKLLADTVLGANPAIAFRNCCCNVQKEGYLTAFEFKVALKLWQRASLDNTKLKDIKLSLQNLGHPFIKLTAGKDRNKYAFLGLALNEEYHFKLSNLTVKNKNRGGKSK